MILFRFFPPEGALVQKRLREEFRGVRVPGKPDGDFCFTSTIVQLMTLMRLPGRRVVCSLLALLVQKYKY